MIYAVFWIAKSKISLNTFHLIKIKSYKSKNRSISPEIKRFLWIILTK